MGTSLSLPAMKSASASISSRVPPDMRDSHSASTPLAAATSATVASRSARRSYSASLASASSARFVASASFSASDFDASSSSSRRSALSFSRFALSSQERECFSSLSYSAFQSFSGSALPAPFGAPPRLLVGLRALLVLGHAAPFPPVRASACARSGAWHEKGRPG